MATLIYVELEDPGLGAGVILNGVMIYHEDEEPGYQNHNFSAREVAERTEKALGIKAASVVLDCGDLSEEWNFDDVTALAIAAAQSKRAES